MADEADPHHPETEPLRRPHGPWWYLMYALGVALLGVCIWLAVRGAEAERGPSGWLRLAEATPGQVLSILALVGANIVINGLIFWAMVKPFEPPDRRVGLRHMTALIAATSLINYLPMRAGMLGRAAYLKQNHQIDYRVSALMMMMVGGGTIGLFGLVVAVTLWRPELDALWTLGMVGGLLLGGALAWPAARLTCHWMPGVEVDLFRRHPAMTMSVATGLLGLRGLDVLCLATRLMIASQIFGSPINLPAALIMATGGMLVTLVTPLPNGLGLREGLYGVFATAGIAGQELLSGSTGVSIGLVDRAAEAIVFIAAGIGALTYLHRRHR